MQKHFVNYKNIIEILQYQKFPKFYFIKYFYLTYLLKYKLFTFEYPTILSYLFKKAVIMFEIDVFNYSIVLSLIT